MTDPIFYGSLVLAVVLGTQGARWWRAQPRQPLWALLFGSFLFGVFIHQVFRQSTLDGQGYAGRAYAFIGVMAACWGVVVAVDAYRKAGRGDRGASTDGDTVDQVEQGDAKKRD